MFTELKQMHRQEANREKGANRTMQKAIKKVEQKQDQLIETQNAQGKITEGLQETLRR